jgi:ribosomal protein L37AE/L43A
VAWVLLGRIRGDDFMVTKITLGLVLSAVGLGIALLPTMLYMATMGTPVGDMLGAEVVPSIPVYLVLSMIGVPPSIIGAITFRRGVRELVESEVLASRIGTAATSGRAGGQQSPQTAELQSSRPQRPQTEQRVPVPATQHPQRETVPRPSSALLFRIRTRSDSKVCPSCGASVEIGAASCPSCGFRFPVDVESGCPVCRSPLNRLTRISLNLYVCGVCFSELEKVAAQGVGRN